MPSEQPQQTVENIMRFFVDDDSGEPWLMLGDIKDTRKAARIAGGYVEGVLQNLALTGDETATVTICQRLMTDKEVNDLPDL